MPGIYYEPFVWRKMMRFLKDWVSTVRIVFGGLRILLSGWRSVIAVRNAAPWKKLTCSKQMEWKRSRGTKPLQVLLPLIFHRTM